MNPHHVYVPIIKGKLNDIKSLGKLSSDIRTGIKPLIEITPLDKKKTSTDEHIHKFCHYLTKHYPLGNIFVDFYGLMPDDIVADGANAIITGFRRLRELGRTLTPTYGFYRNDNIWTELREIVEEFGQGICFRVSIDDLDDHAEETWSQIIERAADLGARPADVDIIIDLRYVGDKSGNELKDLVLDFLAPSSRLVGYRSIIIAGSSALKTVSTIDKDGVGEVSRMELSLWAELRRDVDEALTLIYGDYGVVHPDFSDRGSSKYTNAKIRYTVGNHILYFRGHGLNYPFKDYAQYHGLASKVTSDSRYRGKNASFGDRYIFDCASYSASHGSPATWVLADMNHHISYATIQTRRLIATLTPTRNDREIVSALEEI